MTPVLWTLLGGGLTAAAYALLAWLRNRALKDATIAGAVQAAEAYGKAKKRAETKIETADQVIDKITELKKEKTEKDLVRLKTGKPELVEIELWNKMNERKEKE